MIGITGVTGKLGSYVANLVDKKGIASIHLARSPERAIVYASAELWIGIFVLLAIKRKRNIATS